MIRCDICARVIAPSEHAKGWPADASAGVYYTRKGVDVPDGSEEMVESCPDCWDKIYLEPAHCERGHGLQTHTRGEIWCERCNR